MSAASLLLAEYEAAISAVLSTAQSYSMGGRQVTRANLAELEAGRDKYKKEVAQELIGGFGGGAFTTVDN
jgi:hypothetical protein